MSIMANDSAFPIVLSGEEYCHGMTKREYFAAMAMQGLMTSIRTSVDPDQAFPHGGFAELAVKQADALIKALNDRA